MDAACESCALWRDHCYWDHMKNEKKPQFSVAASDDFKNSVHIPQKISTHLRGRISDTIKLNAPNGITYDAVVSWEMGQAVLRFGWDAFVTAHQIEGNDTFLFMYLGDSNFEIRILDSDGCEKTASYLRPPSNFLGAFPPNVPCDLHLPNEQAVLNSRQVHRPIEFDYTMSTGCYLTNEQDEKVVEIASTIRSEIPLYVAVMNKINVNMEINIPLRLLDHFKEETASTTILEGTGRTYSVGAIKYSEDQVVLRSGWDAFVAANHIQTNDLLIFSSKGKTRLKVLTLDPSGCQKTSPSFAMKDILSTTKDSVQNTVAPPCTAEIIDLTSSDDDHIPREDARRSPGWQKQVPACGAKTRKMASTSSPHTKSEFGTHKLNDRASEAFGVYQEPSLSNDLQGPSGLPYILAQGVTLTESLEKKVQEKVQAIGSELPIYVAVMTKSCVLSSSVCLVFSRKYASYLPSGGQRGHTLTLQVKGKDWRTTLHLGSTSKAIHGGWSKFAAENNLRLGDICLFAKRRTGGLVMSVHVIRNSV